MISADETETETETPAAAKRERESYPVRILTRGADGGYRLQTTTTHATIAQAERWIRTEGADGATYLLARVIGARTVQPRRVEEVAL